MQTTLLGLGIAIILALVAALVGPQFVDWNQYRSVFEANASRLVGVNVRVAGHIDMRLLPTPLVVLRDIEAVSPRGEPLVKAGELKVELALGPLMRGDWRASEMRILKPEFLLALGSDGRLDWPGGTPAADANALAIERLAIEDGRAVLTDAASGARRTLTDLRFNGDVRSLAGPYRGEGSFVTEGGRVGYRLATGRLGDDGIRIKLSLEPERPLNLDTDGMLRFDNGAPRFEGTLTLARRGATPDQPVAPGAEPWRTTARVKASPAAALFDNVEFQYGPEDRAIKLTGTAEIKLGASPQLDAVVSARQVDIDRLLGLPDDTRRLPLAVVRAFADTFGGAVTSPFPVRVGIGIDNVTLAGAAVQNLRGDLRSDGDGSWNLQTFEFRVPGFTQVRASGRFAMAERGATFTGPASVEAGDPKALLAWLEGRDPIPEPARPLRASGDVTLGRDLVGIERLKAEFDRKAISGRLAYGWAAAGRPAHLAADITAPELDIDGALAFVRAALAGTRVDMPGEVALALDLGTATLAGIEAKGAKAKLKLAADSLVLEKVSIADLGGSAVELNGRIDGLNTAPRGTVTFDLDAHAFDGVTAILAKFAPEAVETFRRVAPRLTPAKLRTTLTVEPRAAGASGDRVKLSLAGRAGTARVSITANAAGDVARPAMADFNLDGRIESERGAALATLLGLDHMVGVDQSPGALNLVAAGRLGTDVRLDGWLKIGGLSVAAKGTLHPSAADAMGSLDVSVAAADMRLPRIVGQAGRSVPLTIETRVVINRDTIALDNVTGTVAGSPVRGRLALTPGDTWRIDGVLDAESIDATALISGAAGAGIVAPKEQMWSSEAFRRGVFADIAGKIELSVGSARFGPTLVAQPLRGSIRFTGDETRFEDMQGTLAGGRLSGSLVLRNGAEGHVVRTSLSLTDANLAALLPAQGRPATGRVTLQFDADGNGFSPAAMVGALRGSGTLRLEQSQFSGLDPLAFTTVIAAVDGGLAPEAAKLKVPVTAGLDIGRLVVPRAEGGFTIASGQVRWGNVLASGDGADLTVGGSFDLAAWLLDLRLTLTGPAEGQGLGVRPDIFVQLRGPPTAPQRSVDVSAFAAWLTVRAVDRESRRLEVLQAERAPPEQARPEAGPEQIPPDRTPPVRNEPPPAVKPETAPPPGPGANAGDVPDIQTPPRRPAAAPAPRHVAPRSAAVPPAPGPEAAPDMPAPIEIRPLPGQGTSGVAPPRKPAVKQNPTTNPRPPAEVPLGRSVLDTLFGPQR